MNLKNYHSDKFCLIGSIQNGVVKLAIDTKEFSYLESGSKPIFLFKGTLYVATKYQLNFPYIKVRAYEELNPKLGINLRFLI